MTTLKRCTLAIVLILALALTTAVPAFAVAPTEGGSTTAGTYSSAGISDITSTTWAKLSGNIGQLMATGTARATLNVASPCVAYVKLVNASTGKTVGVSTMNVTAGNTGRNITFVLSPNPLPSGIYDVWVQFDKAGISYSLTVNSTVN